MTDKSPIIFDYNGIYMVNKSLPKPLKDHLNIIAGNADGMRSNFIRASHVRQAIADTTVTIDSIGELDEDGNKKTLNEREIQLVRVWGKVRSELEKLLVQKTGNRVSFSDLPNGNALDPQILNFPSNT